MLIYAVGGWAKICYYCDCKSCAAAAVAPCSPDILKTWTGRIRMPQMARNHIGLLHV